MTEATDRALGSQCEVISRWIWSKEALGALKPYNATGAGAWRRTTGKVSNPVVFAIC